MELKVDKNHKKMGIKEIDHRFKMGAFGIAMGLNMALFSGAGVLPPVQTYAAESQAFNEHHELTDAERLEPANIPSAAFGALDSINEGREKDGLPKYEDEKEITRGDVEKYLNNVLIYVDSDMDLSWLNDCKNLERISLEFKDDKATKTLDNVDFSKLTNLKEMELVRLYSYDLSDRSNDFNEKNYGFVLQAPSLRSFEYKNIDSYSYTDPEFVYKISNMPNLKVLTLSVDSESIDYTKIGTSGNLKEFNITGEPGTIAVSLTTDEIENMRSRGIDVNITDGKYENSDVSKRVEEINKKLDEIMKELDLRKNMTDEEKRDAIILYVIEHLEYDPEVAAKQNDPNYVESSTDVEKGREKFYKDGSIYAALEEDTQICGNYAALFQALAERSGIESYVIHSHNHAYNLVNIDGKYLFVDPTGVDGTTIGRTVTTYDKDNYETEEVELDDGSKITVIKTDTERYDQSAADYMRENPDDASKMIQWLGMDPSRLEGLSEDDSHYSLNIPEGIQITPVDDGKEIPNQNNSGVKETEEEKSDKEDGKPKINKLFKVIVDNKRIFFISGAMLTGMLSSIAAIKIISDRKRKQRLERERRSQWNTGRGSSGFNDSFDDELWM